MLKRWAGAILPLAWAIVTICIISTLASAPSPASAEPSNCVQLGAKHDYACAYHAPGTGGGVYLDDVLFENWYYWHPKAGDMVVDETYAKGSAPGFHSFTGHRTIHFADSHEVADGAWLANFPRNNRPPTDCSQAENDGLVQACTPAEQRSAMDFQYAMAHDGIHHSF